MKSAAIITGPYTYLDHLGVLSSILGIPLIVVDEKTYELGKKFYPDMQIELKDYSELTLDYLAQNIEVLFQTGKFWAEDLIPFIKLLHLKEIRVVYCPHGNSDKGHSLSDTITQDISLVYGQHMLDHLKKTKTQVRKTITTGNYRYPYYLKHQQFYDELTKNIPSENTIFYAPTWNDTSFFSSIDSLVANLGKYNLLIKLHPFLEEHYPAHTYHILSKYENHPHVFIINDFPPIYPLLAKASLYLGDYSSIGYDFLAFDRPLYFLTLNNNFALDKCGMHIPRGVDIVSFIGSTFEKNRKGFAKAREETYKYVFTN